MPNMPDGRVAPLPAQPAMTQRGHFGCCSRCLGSRMTFNACLIHREREMLQYMCAGHLSKLFRIRSRTRRAPDSRATSSSRSYLAKRSRYRTMRQCWSSMCLFAKSTSCLAVTAGSSMTRQRLIFIIGLPARLAEPAAAPPSLVAIRLRAAPGCHAG